MRERRVRGLNRCVACRPPASTPARPWSKVAPNVPVTNAPAPPPGRQSGRGGLSVAQLRGCRPVGVRRQSPRGRRRRKNGPRRSVPGRSQASDGAEGTPTAAGDGSPARRSRFQRCAGQHARAAANRRNPGRRRRSSRPTQFLVRSAGDRRRTKAGDAVARQPGARSPWPRHWPWSACPSFHVMHTRTCPHEAGHDHAAGVDDAVACRHAPGPEPP